MRTLANGRRPVGPHTLAPLLVPGRGPPVCLGSGGVHELESRDTQGSRHHIGTAARLLSREYSAASDEVFCGLA